MSLSTYSDLQTSIANWLARSSDTQITGNATDFIALCESRVHYGSSDPQFPSQPLRIRAMEASRQILLASAVVGGTTTGSANAHAVTISGVSSLTLGLQVTFIAGYTNTGATTIDVSSTGATAIKVGSSLAALTGGEIVAGATHALYFDGTYWILLPGSNGVPLPTDFLGSRRFYIAGSPPQPLVQHDPELNATMSASVVNGRPNQYAIEADTFVFTPPPDGSYYLQLLYYKKFPALSVSQTTNWLLTNKPDVYLYGSLLEASLFTNSVDQAAIFARGFMAAVNSLSKQDAADRYRNPQMRTDFAPV